MQFQFENFTAFMTMGGHGPYVWASYGITFACLVYLLLAPLRRRRALLADVRRQQRIAQRDTGQNGPYNKVTSE